MGFESIFVEKITIKFLYSDNLKLLMKESSAKSPYEILTFDAFVRAVAVNRSSPHALFLGAGASISSGVKSAGECIWEWKRQIFASKNPELSSQLGDFSLDSVRLKVQRWLDEQDVYPPFNSNEEYGFYAEQCYPLKEDRRRFFQELSLGVDPHVGYRVLSLLAEADVITSVWTTNFDGLTVKAINSTGVKLAPIEIGLESAERAIRQIRRGELLHVALHGDYRYDDLKNTPEELQNWHKTHLETLVQRLKNDNLVVIGYSGRDKCVMDALKLAYSSEGTGRLYWCGHGDGDPPDTVKQLLEIAKSKGRTAVYVSTRGFDETMLRLGLLCFENNAEKLERVRGMYSGAISVLEPEPFKIEQSRAIGVIKSNAFQIRCPSEVFQFEVEGLKDKGVWDQLRKICEGHQVVAVPVKGKVLAIGTIDSVKGAFGESIKGDITRVLLDARELANTDSHVISLLTQALVRSIAGMCEIPIDNEKLIWMPRASSFEFIYQTNVAVHDAAILSLRRYGGKQYLVIKPTVKGFSDGEPVNEDITRELKRKLLTKQFNNKFNDAVNQWRNFIFDNGKRKRFEFPINTASDFRFEIRTTPAFARINSSKLPSITLPEAVERLVVYEGIQLDEPTLLLSSKNGLNSTRDTHPLRGVLQNQPYDFPLNGKLFSSEIKLGVICPNKDTARFYKFLSGLNTNHKKNPADEYLMDYPGFAGAFGLPILVPQPNSTTWLSCPEPNSDVDVKTGALQLVNNICTLIDQIRSTNPSTVFVIYIPERWKKWEKYNLEGETFDLHDFIKAHGVKNGVSTQLIREDTLSDPYPCRVIWWLSLSFYVKSFRTPWILDSMDKQTAFLGLGFRVDRSGENGNHIILGCSHIYSASGLGLKYQLSKLENPIVRRGNPFMSKDDARRTGESVRELFFQSIGNLPKRVVIHKRTPFNRDEQEGLLEGLSGIEVVDMLEINLDPSLRYVASYINNGQVKGDGFPVRRGTAIVLDNRRALLWVHGTAAAVSPGRKYYMGGSRIPAPLIVTRYHGTTAFLTLAKEILGLSKMNWNTFDLYNKIPATIASSNDIAKIGVLLERFGDLSYDYRLFI
jgi:hypothetical protein